MDTAHATIDQIFWFLYTVSPQQGDSRLSDPLSGLCGTGGPGTCNRKDPADLKADSLSTMPLINWCSSSDSSDSTLDPIQRLDTCTEVFRMTSLPKLYLYREKSKKK
ncbi:hypothetical protein PoB_006629600 [Plakobranchus ocellatus]|uniref:Uncharacterized protein n=1 Tax=Plakobranchus ocellatus TaxID=259542 RepID=A0AAV4D6I6_9GAST|nr:hypothetical protein PoB_006629600 [Plakobranchus ocellatus]